MKKSYNWNETLHFARAIRRNTGVISRFKRISRSRKVRIPPTSDELSLHISSCGAHRMNYRYTLIRTDKASRFDINGLEMIDQYHGHVFSSG